jgi:hypothetical protein
MNYSTLREAVGLMVEQDTGRLDTSVTNMAMAHLVINTPIAIMSIAEDQALHIKKVAPLAEVAVVTKDLLERVHHGVLDQVLSEAHHYVTSLTQDH